MQMRREAQQQEWSSKSEGGFSSFVRGLQDAARRRSGGFPSDLGGGDSSTHGVLGATGNNNAGSPLKYEMGGAGGEMLPVMRERY